MEFEISMSQQSESAIQAAGRAMELMRQGDVSGALALTRQHPGDGLARRVTVEALVSLQDWRGVREFCAPPQSSAEIVALSEALYQLGDKPALRAFVESDAVVQSTDAAVRQIAEQARSRLGGTR